MKHKPYIDSNIFDFLDPEIRTNMPLHLNTHNAVRYVKNYSPPKLLILII